MADKRQSELSFDGKGINGPDEYRSRVATFANGAAADRYGALLAAAPDLLALAEHIAAVADDAYLCGNPEWVCIAEQAAAALRRARGETD